MAQEQILEELEHAKTRRKVIRTAFTKLVNEITEILNSVDESNKTKLNISFCMLNKKNDELLELNDKILNLKIIANSKDEQLEEESQTVDKYFRTFLEIQESVSNVDSGHRDEVASSFDNFSRRRFKLPKLELRKFDGNIKDWLQFWCQFEKIDSDDGIDPADKFQYLIQSTVKGSRARDVVESFPPTSENYANALECLKSRFGRDDMLVEVYIRELLQLVLKNASTQRPNMSILYDSLESHIRALESLHVTTEKCGAMLYPLVESCLPEDSLRAFSRSKQFVAGTDPKKRLEGLLSFLKSEVESEERISLAMSGFGLKPKVKKQFCAAPDSTPTAAGLLTTSNSNQDNKSCSFCSKQHETMNCFNAQKMSLSEKQKVLKEKGCCFKCMTRGHRRDQCKVFVRCIVCSKGHATLMCPGIYLNKKSESEKHVAGVNAGDSSVNSVNENSVNLSSLSHSPKVFLQTLVVKLKGPHSVSNVRALIDTGSQKSYILKSTALNMRFRPLREEIISHSLFGGTKTRQEKHNCYKIELGSLQGKFLCNFEALDEPVICDSISSVIDGPWMDELENLNISIYDIEKNPGPIEVLIGADVAGRLLTGRRKILKCNLVAIETLLGWSLMGKLPAHDVEESSAMLVTSLLLKEASISDMWDLDVIGISDPATKKSKEEKEFLTREQFLNTVTLNEEGRYEVSLPWSEDHLPLPSNKNLALKRLESTTRKLDSEGLFSLYDESLKEWLSLGIIEEVPLDQNVEAEHYLPHRPVFKTNSTTKVRPVFDASAREKLSPSLNQCLESGPNLMNLIPALLLKFRELKHGVVADIEKAFLMISVNPLERDILRFLWWSEKRKLKIFRHARVVFGVKCSPFLLASVIEFHLLRLSEESSYDKQMLMKLLKSFYVDNVLASFSTQKDLIEFMRISQEVMKLGNFNLRGWEYTEDVAYPTTSAVLGLLWNRTKDVLSINLDWLENLEFGKITKRTILSVAHKAFDPIGLASPVFLVPKLLLQKLWKKGFSWDVEVDDSTKAEFLSWYNKLVFLKEIAIPRWFSYDADREFSVHTFYDASLQAYSAAVFIRVQTPNYVYVHLLASKARVTPVKTVTIPRLELIAATVGARLCTSVLNGLDWENVQLYFWSDSTTVLNWIQRDEIWSTFVNNRVQEIRKLTGSKLWRHVPGCLNPADLPSRGCSGKQLLLSKWWEGPLWLKGSKEEWPDSEEQTDEDEVSRERVRSLVSINLSTHETAWYLRFSKYTTIVRLAAWILRFGANCRNTVNRRGGELSVDEIHLAEQKLLKIVQQERFSDTVTTNKLKGLNAFRDDAGLVRVKTKILRRKDEENFKCPIVLPSDHPLVEQLIYERHLISCHSGTQVVLSDLRQQFWILRGRKTVQRIIKRCIRCKRYTSKKLETVPAPLPEERVRDALVFEVTGVDLAGPLHLKKGDKTWILLFTCAVYRAIHLELIQSLSTDGFLLGLRRFIARRGRPRKMYSDNGTNFVGAVNQMASLDWNKILQESSILRIQWIFSPPTAAWWGGFWERMVQMVKNILRRVLGRASINFEELSTILCDAEAVINSRPLNYLSEDPEDLTPLTPAMFLQDIQTVGVPDLDNLDGVNLSKRFKYQQKLRENLRKRFREEYLSMLIHQQANKADIKRVQVGDVVLIGCDKRRLDWPMGRVVEVFPGKDNSVRVVKVKTCGGELLRPVQRLYPLELDCNSELFDNETFKHVKTNHLKGQIKFNNHKCKTGFGKIRNDEQCTDVMKTKCGRTVKKPARFN